MTDAAEKLLAELVIKQNAMMTEIRALRAQLEGHPATAEGWTDSANAAIALKPEGVKSQAHLQKLRRSGIFSESKGEIKNRSEGDRPTWYYHVPSCRKALQRHFRSLKAV